MSAKHTPGPWIVGHKLQNSIVTDTLQHGELAVADVNIIRAESAANARLIAAAPDLLEALRMTAQALAWLAHGECRGFHTGLPTANESLDSARAAIAKAIG